MLCHLRSLSLSTGKMLKAGTFESPHEALAQAAGEPKPAHYIPVPASGAGMDQEKSLQMHLG